MTLGQFIGALEAETKAQRHRMRDMSIAMRASQAAAKDFKQFIKSLD